MILRTSNATIILFLSLLHVWPNTAFSDCYEPETLAQKSVTRGWQELISLSLENEVLNNQQIDNALQLGGDNKNQIFRRSLQNVHLSAHRLDMDIDSWNNFVSGKKEDLIKNNQSGQGCNTCQQVSPSIALDQYLEPYNKASLQWGELVNKYDYERTKVGLLTCDAAINMLNEKICGDNNNGCDIEKEFKKKCVGRSLDRKTYSLCYIAEESYRDA